VKTVDELQHRIAAILWFSRLGEPDYTGRAGFIPLPKLEEWCGVTDVLPNEPAFWCRAVDVYYSGHWPCGLMPDGRLVVL
jgi:hypothetical protein